MEEVIKKAIQGGWNTEFTDYSFEKWGIRESYCEYQTYKDIVCDPLFWQALQKSCGWHIAESSVVTDWGEIRTSGKIYNALKFYEINLTQGWNEAEKWLQNLIKE